MKPNGKQARSKQKAIPFLLSCKDYSQASKEIGVSESQIFEWLKDPEFKAELDSLRNEIIEEAVNILKSSTVKAVTALRDLLDSSNEVVRRGVANDILNHVVKFKELQEFENRLTALEVATKEEI